MIVITLDKDPWKAMAFYSEAAAKRMLRRMARYKVNAEAFNPGTHGTLGWSWNGQAEWEGQALKV